MKVIEFVSVNFSSYIVLSQVTHTEKSRLPTTWDPETNKLHASCCAPAGKLSLVVEDLGVRSSTLACLTRRSLTMFPCFQGIAFILIVMPVVITRPAGDMHCIASGPTLVVSLLFIVLYIRRKVPLFMEKMYLFFQIIFTFGAFIQCFLLNISQVWLWLTYGMFYFSMLTALSLDLYMIANERGCTFSCAWTVAYVIKIMVNIIVNAANNQIIFLFCVTVSVGVKFLTKFYALRYINPVKSKLSQWSNSNILVIFKLNSLHNNLERR